jgi:Cytidylyltransferase family
MSFEHSLLLVRHRAVERERPTSRTAPVPVAAIKREFGTKDAGAWLPGFGGLLDRIDSLIIVLPLGYYGLRAAGLALG